jgi:hypothetical protein
MAENNKTALLKVALMILAIVSIIYGLLFFIIPGVMVNLTGGNAVDLVWLRWPGGLLIALGIGNIMVFRRPEKQDVWVLVSALGTLLAGLAMIYSLIFNETSGNKVNLVISIVIHLVVSCLLWIGRQQAKDIL